MGGNKTGTSGLKELLRQVAWFCSGGLINTTIFYGTYFLLHELKVYYILCYAAGFVASVLFAYWWNRNITFKSQVEGDSKSRWTIRIIKCFTLYISTFLLSSLLLFLLVEQFRMHEKVAPLLSMFITMPLNFLFNKIWVFKPERKN